MNLLVLTRIYSRRDFSVQLDSILTLRRASDKLMHAVDEHFRKVYIRHPPQVLFFFNPYFLVAWQVNESI